MLSSSWSRYHLGIQHMAPSCHPSQSLPQAEQCRCPQSHPVQSVQPDTCTARPVTALPHTDATLAQGPRPCSQIVAQQLTMFLPRPLELMHVTRSCCVCTGLCEKRSIWEQRKPNSRLRLGTHLNRSTTVAATSTSKAHAPRQVWCTHQDRCGARVVLLVVPR